MDLSNLSKTGSKSKKRVGRGHGSGRGGHTSGRGSKGQNSRSKPGLFFEGTKFKKSLIKRLPLFRGKGKLKPRSADPLIINIKFLEVFKEGDQVTFATLQEKGIIIKNLPTETKLKILGEGTLTKGLIVSLPCSKSAKEKIEKAGGKVVSKDTVIETKPKEPLKKVVEPVKKKETKKTKSKNALEEK